MSQNRVNFHRSFGALLVGNVIAVFVSGLFCVISWQVIFPDFYDQLREHIQSTKQAKKQPAPRNQEKKAKAVDELNKVDELRKDEPDKDKQRADEDKPDPNPRQDLEEKIVPLPDFHLGIWITTLTIDLFFAAVAGWVCVWIAGFSRNTHAMLMALFIMVWKAQQLFGFVENQAPPSLILAEFIGLPIACFLGASFFPDSPPADETRDDNGTDDRGNDAPET